MPKFQLTLLAALILIGPSCGGGGKSVPAPLLQETFSGTFPGTNWSAVSPPGATPNVGIVNGMLEFSASAATGAATTTTLTTFGIPNVSFSVQMAATAAAGLKGTGTIEIIDGTPTVIASVTWNPETSSIAYAILGTSSAGISPVPNSNGALNHFVFSIDSAGKGTWSLNNVAQVNNATAITATPLRIKLGATFGTGTSWPVFDFDNVTVTNP